MKHLKVFVLLAIILLQATTSNAQIAELVKLVTSKVIKAMDEQVQEEQNRVIALQVWQQNIENDLSKQKLAEIGSWVSRQKELYSDYFKSLQDVTPVIRDGKQVIVIIDRQKELVDLYYQFVKTTKTSSRFSLNEIKDLTAQAQSILDQSLDNLERVIAVCRSISFKMDDAGRLQMIDGCKKTLDNQMKDLTQLYQRVKMTKAQRDKEIKEIVSLQKLYGL